MCVNRSPLGSPTEGRKKPLGEARHRQPSGIPGQAVDRLLNTTSLTTGEPAEKSYIEWFLEGKSRSVGPTLSHFDSNSRNV
jgi:hypothetical protein